MLNVDQLNKDFNRNKKLFKIWFAFCTVLWIGGLIAGVWVAAHFIAKFW